MEGPLVSVSMGVMKRLLAKLTKLLEEKYDKLRGVSKQIKFLRDELRAMSPALEMLGDAQQLSPLMRYWRAELRELTYDMEDCVDDFLARVDHDNGEPTGLFWSLFHRIKKLITRHEIADEIEELKNRVMEVSERHKRYNFAESATNNFSTSAVDPRLPALYEEIDRLVGIDRPKEHIIKLLLDTNDGSSARRLRVLSIAGCGGLGKTTLANQVYQTIKTQFYYSAFVSVSQTPDIKKILRDIAKEVGITTAMLDDDEPQLLDKLRDIAKEVKVTTIMLDDDERQLLNILREHLKNKSYFVVIDDIWDTKAWEFIKLALPRNNKGSRIITTTRSLTVAKCSSQDRYVYEMEPLSFDDSKRLFFKRAFGSEDLLYPQLKGVSDSILRKCGGLPLALITVSSMLTNKYSKAEWDRVHTAIGFALAENPEAEKMTSILSLSYFDIPSHLRTCLLYLSVFPEDYRIEKQCLINRWIAEGFIQEEQGQNAYEIGERYFNDLINRSMIQSVDIMHDNQAEACRVHDIILDYIKCKAAEENFATSLDAAKLVHASSEYKVRRLCVINNINEQHVTTLWANRILSHVRSVTMCGRSLLMSSLSRFILLRVLDLDLADCYMMDHELRSIEKLFHLKYLRLSSSSVAKLPEKIGELEHLQTLDVRGTSVRELPSSITKVKGLARLYVNPSTKFPEGTISQMHSLEELRTYGVESYEQLKYLQEFSKLTKLRTLEIRWKLDMVVRSEGIRQVEAIQSYTGSLLLSSCNLLNLYISDTSLWRHPLSLDSWKPDAPCSLRKLCMKGSHIYKVPNWMGSLGNLEALELIIICVKPNDLDILGEIPTLLFLTLCTAGGTGGRIAFRGTNGFRSLKNFSLYISACGTALEFEATSMPKLEHLKLVFPAHKMECLNGASNMGIQHLSALTKIDIEIRGGIDGTFGCVARLAINAAVERLPHSPTIMFKTTNNVACVNFKSLVRALF